MATNHLTEQQLRLQQQQQQQHSQYHYPGQHPQRQWYTGHTGQQTAQQLNGSHDQHTNSHPRLPSYTTSLAATGRPLRGEPKNLGRSPSTASHFSDLIHLSVDEPRRQRLRDEQRKVESSEYSGKTLRHTSSKISDSPSTKSDPDDIDDTYLDKHIEAMDYDSKHGYQRDWDRKALGNFEMAIIDGKQSRLSSSGGTFADEKAGASLTKPDGDLPPHEYPSTPRLLLLSIGLALIVFTMSLDNTIIATAIPKITENFANGIEDVGWYGSAYLVTTTALQPTFGKFFQYFDVKWTYLSAIVVFELGSVVCALAQSSMTLIVGRAVAGVGAAALFSGSMTILGYSVPLQKRAIYLGCMSSMFGIASVVGPIMGGALTDNLNWRWCFWINLPFGAVSIAAIFFFFENPKLRFANMPLKQKILEMDLGGSALFIGAIVCLLLALQWGGVKEPWSSPRVAGCLAAFAIMFVIFCLIQWKLGDRGTMPPRVLIFNRTVAASAVFTFLFAMALYTHIFYLPFYFQTVKGSSAEQSGIQCIPYLISVTVGGIATGAFITTVGLYCPPMYLGSAIFVVGSGLLYTLRVDSGPGQWIGYQVVAGFGVGCMVQCPFIAMQAVLSEEDMPIGNAVAAFFNTFGGAIALAIDNNIFVSTAMDAVLSFAKKAGVNEFEIALAGPTGVYRVFGDRPDQLAAVLFAYNYVVTTIFILPITVAIAAFFVSFIIKWKSVKGTNLLAAVG